MDAVAGPVRTPSPAREATELRSGVMLGGHYRLERRLGAGGMGEAWEATHIVIKKKVALKVLSSVDDEGDQQDRSERMLREAKVVANIEHPNIVQIVDFGSTPDGAPFLVMELVRGSSLREVCETDGPLAWPRARNLLAQVADALAASHEQGVVHRDVKPDNILIALKAGEEEAKVIDFGIAKSITLDEESRRLTRTGAICGTPAFMSPEQIRGEPVDGRTDVYSLGCMAYELVVGHRPFEGSTPHELIYGHLFRTIETVPGSLPEAFVTTILRCLQKDPADRFPTMSALHDALIAIDGSVMATVAADHLPVPVPGAAGGTDVLRWASDSSTTATAVGVPPPAEPPRRRPVLALAAVAIFGLVGFGIWSWVRTPPSEPATTVAAPPPPAAPLAVGSAHATSTSSASSDGTDTGSDTASDEDSDSTGFGGGDESSTGQPEVAEAEPPKTRRRRSRRSRPKSATPPPTVPPPKPPKQTDKKPPERRPDGTFDLFPN